MTPSQAQNELPSVMIVEDERELADLYAAWLSDSYAIETVYSGEKALEQVNGNVDVVLLDRRMPGVSGDEVLDHIRNEGYDIRVVIVSAVTPDFDVIEMGFDDYLVKPVDREELHATVERMLARADYDDAMKEFEQLAATKATLEAEKSTAELQENEAYRDLEARLETIRSNVDGVIDGFGKEDFEAAFRDLSPHESSESGEGKE